LGKFVLKTFFFKTFSIAAAAKDEKKNEIKGLSENLFKHIGWYSFDNVNPSKIHKLLFVDLYEFDFYLFYRVRIQTVI
jgi:hypothetical protein